LTRGRIDQEELARRCGLHPEHVRRFVALGLVPATRDAHGALWFSASQVAAVARLQRLRAALPLNYAALGLVVDLLDRIGFETELLRANDTDLDYLASRQTVGGQELHVVHVRKVDSIANPADVRDLHHAVRRERADAGTLLITGGFDPRSFEYANGKPLHLLDGYGLVALCAKHGIPAYLDRAPAESSSESEDDDSEGRAASVPSQRARSLPSAALRMGR
jgi:hypothetical protein